MQQSTKHIVSVCDQIFNPKECQELARKHLFVQRSSSKIRGDEFVKMLVLPSKDLATDSLNGLCLRMKEFNPEVDISASALAQRINTLSAVEFMKACMQKILRYIREGFIKQNTGLEGVLSYFNNVYLEDSTVFELSQHLHKEYPGTKRGGKKGGASCKAQMKLDLIHNFTKGTIKNVEIFEGKRPDQALTGRILGIIEKSDLVIRDLGYFKLGSLRSISEKGAYFLSRMPSHIQVFLRVDDERPVDLSAYFKKKFKHSQKIDIDVWIGAERLPVRLVAYRIPKDVIKERNRKAHKNAKEIGRTLSKAKLDLLGFSLFVTNVPREVLPAEIVGTVYRLRWEIELIFKQWKSILKIDVLKGICPYRIDCLIWGRLCQVILLAGLIANFMNLAKKLTQGELSPEKLVHYLIRNDRLCNAVKRHQEEDFEQEIIKDIERRLLKDKRARTTMRSKVINLEPYYGL